MLFSKLKLISLWNTLYSVMMYNTMLLKDCFVLLHCSSSVWWLMIYSHFLIFRCLISNFMLWLNCSTHPRLYWHRPFSTLLLRQRRHAWGQHDLSRYVSLSPEIKPSWKCSRALEEQNEIAVVLIHRWCRNVTLLVLLSRTRCLSFLGKLDRFFWTDFRADFLLVSILSDPCESEKETR